MTRDELQDRIVAIAKDAAAARYYHIASVLYFVAGAIAGNYEDQAAKALAAIANGWQRRN